MIYYLKLQITLIFRYLRDFGIQPVVGVILGAGVFVFLSLLLFQKTEAAIFIYCFAALSFTFHLSETSRNYFLKSVFTNKQYLQVRILENMLIISPFILIINLKEYYIYAVGLLAASVLLSLNHRRQMIHFTIPTPFGRWPFELVTGFRQSYPLILFLWFTALMSLVYHNFNLGLVTLLILYMFCSFFFMYVENEYFVWIYNLTPKKFLLKKIITSYLGATLISAPVITILIIGFSGQLPIIFAGVVAGLLLQSLMILTKYSVYPEKMNLPQILLLTISFMFPPLLLAVIPFFYIQSVKKLSEILK